MSIGTRIKKLRGEKNLADFGAELGVSGQQISKIEHGNSSPSLELATKICEYYNVTMDWLIRGVENQNIVEEPRSDYISISKDELLKLQRLALDKTERELDERTRQVEQLKNAD